MPEKKTISGRVPADTEERFEEFRMRRGLNKTDAMRRLIEEGLDSYEQDESAVEGSATADESEDVKIGPLTQSEKWFRQKFESFFAGALLSAPAALTLFLAFALLQYLGLVNASDGLPGLVLISLFAIAMLVFLVFGVGTIITLIALKFGIARWLNRWGAEENGAAG
jgi:predicted DNA-binding protein